MQRYLFKGKLSYKLNSIFFSPFAIIIVII